MIPMLRDIFFLPIHLTIFNMDLLERTSQDVKHFLGKIAKTN